MKTNIRHFLHKRYTGLVLSLLAVTIVTVAVASCTVSLSLNGSNINYDKVKTISINKFPIRSNYVWAPMEAMFYNSITDKYAQRTKLQIVKRNADLQLEGEITEYSQTNKSISSDGFSSQTQLKMTVNVRFKNNTNHSEDFERTFSATTEYDSKLQLTSVQDQLVQEMTDQIIDQIFNATVANW
ncbi:MAG: hypothetical protein K5874_04565 [Bacteroidaceae bacterium]|nr:hypothetical protein [Bacteroidaceae bacterium]